MCNKIPDDMAKKIISVSASVIVVISGLAIVAGSKPTFFARIGSKAPILVAVTEVPTKVSPTIIARFLFPF